jgi:hypothetical protein
MPCQRRLVRPEYDGWTDSAVAVVTAAAEWRVRVVTCGFAVGVALGSAFIPFLLRQRAER